MKGLRLKFMVFLYNWSSRRYADLFKPNKKAWGISKTDFMLYPDGSLGQALGHFYLEKGFDVMPKLENHDVYHVLTETNTAIQDEIAMQFLLLGNGKLSLYLIAMICIGGIVFPEYAAYYTQSYYKGKRYGRFFDIEFKEFLIRPLEEVQQQMLNQLYQLKIK